MVILCLFDFHITDTGRHAIIKNVSKTNAYINQALIPMVLHYKNQCNLIAWEIINEPEWIMNSIPGGGGYSGGPVTIIEMQRFVGMCASAIHSNCTIPVTVGSASIKWNSDLSPAAGNYWSDSDLKTSTNNDSKAYLDFYQIHYYDWMLTNNNLAPFNRTKASWGLDKPTLVGESGNEGYFNYQQQFDYSYQNGYAGCLIWAYLSGGAATWNDFNSEMNNFKQSHLSVVEFSCILLSTVDTKNFENFSSPAIVNSGEEIIIKFESLQDVESISIVDMKGALQSEFSIENQQEIMFNQNWECGLYLLILKTKENIYYRRLIIQ